MAHVRLVDSPRAMQAPPPPPSPLRQVTRKILSPRTWRDDVVRALAVAVGWEALIRAGNGLEFAATVSALGALGLLLVSRPTVAPKSPLFILVNGLVVTVALCVWSLGVLTIGATWITLIEAISFAFVRLLIANRPLPARLVSLAFSIAAAALVMHFTGNIPLMMAWGFGSQALKAWIYLKPPVAIDPSSKQDMIYAHIASGVLAATGVLVSGLLYGHAESHVFNLETIDPYTWALLALCAALLIVYPISRYQSQYYMPTKSSLQTTCVDQVRRLGFVLVAALWRPLWLDEGHFLYDVYEVGVVVLFTVAAIFTILLGDTDEKRGDAESREIRTVDYMLSV